MRLILVSDEDVQHAASELSSLGRDAISLLADAVEHTGITRAKLSNAAKKLESAHFVRISGGDAFFRTPYTIMPTLDGEEALEFLDHRRENK